eukprot:4045265-Prymnesium_polylepis.1
MGHGTWTWACATSVASQWAPVRWLRGADSSVAAAVSHVHWSRHIEKSRAHGRGSNASGCTAVAGEGREGRAAARAAAEGLAARAVVVELVALLPKVGQWGGW